MCLAQKSPYLKILAIPLNNVMLRHPASRMCKSNQLNNNLILFFTRNYYLLMRKTVNLSFQDNISALAGALECCQTSPEE